MTFSIYQNPERSGITAYDLIPLIGSRKSLLAFCGESGYQKNLIPKPSLVKMDFFQEYSRLGNPGYFFLSRMMNFGMMGQKLPLMEKMAFKVFDEAMERKERKKTFYTWQAHCEYSKQVC